MSIYAYTENAPAATAVNPADYIPLTQSNALTKCPASLLQTSAQNLSNFRNVLDGGDFTVNPWQRGTSFTSIANTLTYTADRWFAVGGASSSISVSRQAQTDVVGFARSLRWGRGSGTNTATINLGQVLESNDTIRLQGQTCTLSFWAKAGAQFSAGNSALSVLVASGTGTDEGASAFVGATWTGYGSLTLTPLQGGAAPAANIAQPITATATRYAFTFAVPATATELGVLLNYAPTGANNTTDTVDFYGLQIEAGALASAFEHRDVQVELEICQRYAWVISEPANNVLVAIGGTTAAANVQNFLFYTPVQMRAAPTLTVTTGGFKVAAGAAAATATISAGSTHTPNQITVTAAVTQSVGQAAHLQGGGGAGLIVASADL